MFDFTRFAMVNQVVVVVPNYRLGLLGFLAFEALSKTSTTGSSGNFGLMDAVAALQWVKLYIAEFGGDPDDVTVFGQSSGGSVILNLLAIPSTVGLFDREISMSGSTNYTMYVDHIYVCYSYSPQNE